MKEGRGGGARLVEERLVEKTPKVRPNNRGLRKKERRVVRLYSLKEEAAWEGGEGDDVSGRKGMKKKRSRGRMELVCTKRRGKKKLGASKKGRWRGQTG